MRRFPGFSPKPTTVTDDDLSLLRNANAGITHQHTWQEEDDTPVVDDRNHKDITTTRADARAEKDATHRAAYVSATTPERRGKQ